VDASGSVDGPGGGGITKYHYNFGDGTTETSPNASATHAYHDLEGQPFLCRVTVTNKKGRSDTSPPVSVEVVAEQPPLPIDCQLSDWSEWSAWIDNGDGTETRTRTRTILVEPANGGAPCDHQEETETRDIVLPPVDCVLGPEFITSETPLEACQPDGFQAVEVAWTKAIVTPPANGGLECGPMSGTRVEKRACEYVPPAVGDHPYHAMLTARDDVFYDWTLRTEDQIRLYDRQPNTFELPMVYDDAMDACLLQIDPTRPGVDGTANEPAMVWLPMAIPADTSFMLTFDQRWDANWESLGAGYAGHYKSLRFDCKEGAVASTWGTLKHFFDKGNILPTVALAMYRMEAGTGHPFVIPPTTIVSEVIQPQANFYIQSDRWVRTWVHYDHALQELSLWAMDSEQGLVQMMHRNKWGFPSTGLKQWRLQFDTSGDQAPALNPHAKAWLRNVVVLRNVNYETVEGLLSGVGL